jgi:dTDP-4-amino-4,6-dideoxygalactose transaminase
MLNTRFSPWPCFTEEEGDAVRRVLLSNRVNYWTGDECHEFEREFATWVGTQHAIALANGTVALDVALHGLGIGARNGGQASDEVVVTPRTYIASVSCVINAGAIPVFAEVDRDSGNISADSIAKVLSQRTRAAIPVHLAGWPCDLDPIMDLAKLRGFKVIEDCAQAHGARYKGRSVGSIGHIGAWSFCQDKVITTGGEGGMITCQDRGLWERMWSFKDHGKSWDAVQKSRRSQGFRWLHETFGTNGRMLEMQAVIGRIQLRRVAQWTAAREVNSIAIETALAPYANTDGPIRLPTFAGNCCKEGCTDGSPAGCRHARYKYYAYVRPENLSEGWSRDKIIDEILRRGAPAFQGSCGEVYLEKAFEGTGLRPPSPSAVARELGETSLMFLVHPTLTNAEMETITNVIASVLATAKKPS